MKKSDMLIMGFRTLNRVLKSEDHSMMAKYLQRIKELEEAIKRFEYNFKKIIIVSIMNTDLKQGLHDYHRGQGRNYFDATGRPRRDRHPTVILFPTFNTIYY